MKRAALISGGGSWGAYGGGTFARLNKEYNTVIGISVGALMSPFVVLREWSDLKAAFTSINEDNIFDKCWYKPKPISKSGKIRKLPILITLLLGQRSIATSNAARKMIDDFFPEIYYQRIARQNKEVIVGTQNLSQIPSQIHYFSSVYETHDDFKDWMWCSSSFPFFTSIVKKNWKDEEGNFHIGEWGDGGLGDLVGLDQLKNKGYDEIDIVLHRTKTQDRFEGRVIDNLIDSVSTVISIMRYNIEFEFFYQDILELNRQGTKVTIYWLPKKPDTSYLVFDEKVMHKWWNEGYDTAFDSNRIQVFNPIKK